ncbi:metalloregulator ArsR/SmtB family transcription factor [bacterium]|nr:metalloregulator ArsR/SmtB family transcription factor [bacterium]
MYLLNIHATEVFQALSDPLRLRIIRMLAHPDIYESCSCDLGDALQEPEYAISRQLKVLRAAGLLTAEKHGRWIFHRLRKDEPSLELLISLILSLPDASGEFKEDHRKISKLVRARSGSRCEGRADSMSRSRKEKRG